MKRPVSMHGCGSRREEVGTGVDSHGPTRGKRGSMDLMLLTARLLLAGIFAIAGVAKLADWPASRYAIVGFGVPSRLSTPLGVLLPLAEITIAIALLSTATIAWWGALGAGILLLFFIIGIGYN